MYLAKVLHRLDLAGRLRAGRGSSPDSHSASSGAELRPLGGREPEQVWTRDLRWLINRLSRLAKYEAGHQPKESLRRTCVIQWIAAVSLELGAASLPPFLPALLRPVYRELVDTNLAAGEALHSLAQEVSEMMKDICGRESFSKAYSRVHQAAAVVRERRRTQAALEVMEAVLGICTSVIVSIICGQLVGQDIRM